MAFAQTLVKISSTKSSIRTTCACVGPITIELQTIVLDVAIRRITCRII